MEIVLEDFVPYDRSSLWRIRRRGIARDSAGDLAREIMRKLIADYLAPRPPAAG
jgi:hypothetical protein